MARFNPPAPNLGGTAIRVTLQTTSQGQLCLTNFDFICTNNPANPSYADLQAAATAFDTAFETDFLACLSPLTTYGQIQVAELFYATTPTWVQIFGSPSPGTAGTGNNPLIMAAVMRKTTNLRGQHGRGRTAFPAVPNTFTTPLTDPNKLNATGLAAYNTLGTALLAGFTSGARTWGWAVLTRPKPPQTLYTQGLLVSAFNMDTILGTVRRRKEGVGI